MAVSGSPSRSATPGTQQGELGTDRGLDDGPISTTGVQGTLRVRQPIGHPIGLAGQGEAPRVGHAELRVARHELRGQRVEPSAHGAQLARVEVAQRCLGHEAAGVAEVARMEQRA